MSTEFLSICIPTFNRAPLLREILNSFATQMRADQISSNDVAFYISDNASADSTPQVIEEFKRHGFRVTSNRNATNIGIHRNLLHIYSLPRGRYWWTVGDDELISDKAIGNLLWVLRQEDPGLLIAFNRNYALELPAPMVYDDYQSFARECIRVNSHALAEHSLMSSNIVRQDCFDPICATENVGTYFPNMYGIMRALLKKRARVLLPDFPVITVRKPQPGASPGDGVWADLDRCWIQYFKWLREEMQMPELDPYAPSGVARRAMLKNLLSHPIDFVHNHWRALFQPTAYRFVISRLFSGLR